ncbi:lipoprotein [Streptococcus acidominimus]|uniref:Lipoprotein n=1 Tax=Streptococcus acidominimus TaxID=1326 RepID=A0A239WKT2_STRAI|nr:hypothetical protein [Streptococcus acidominimus]SNV35032.1 lipoprotein [Streptococcus acidominimus]
MLKSKSEILFLSLSMILLLALGGIYFIYGRSSQESSATPVPKVSQSSSSSEKNKQEQEAEKAVKALEDDPTENHLKAAQEAVDKLPDSKVKSQLQERITKIKTELDNQTAAETAVATAETSLVMSDIDAAQEAINKLKDGDKKTELQNRLDLLLQNLGYQTSAIETPESGSAPKVETEENNQAEAAVTTESVQSQPTPYRATPVVPVAPAPRVSIPSSTPEPQAPENVEPSAEVPTSDSAGS